MKKIITFFTALIICANMFAQSPEKMSYQAVVRDASNNLVSSSIVGMQISILQGSVSGTAVFVERHAPTSNLNGLVTLEIGSGTLVSGDFSTIDWSNGPYFIKTETDPTGGTTYTITGISQLLSVPYALHAKTAESISGGITETDPVFGASVSNGITGSDTTNWNNKQDQLSAGANISIAGNVISAVNTGFTHYIGEQFGGGIIFHLWKDSSGIEHGLIVDGVDLDQFSIWSDAGPLVFGPRSTWDGLSNSNYIIAEAGHTNSAALECLNSTNNGQSDWYLPSVDEMSLLWQNRFNVNKSISTLGLPDPLNAFSQYWTSTFDLSLGMYYYDFANGSCAITINNLDTKYVRAIRAF